VHLEVPVDKATQVFLLKKTPQNFFLRGAVPFKGFFGLSGGWGQPVLTGRGKTLYTYPNVPIYM
jgi:hypothetical protein